MQNISIEGSLTITKEFMVSMNKKEDKISVIIPMFNVEPYIENCVKIIVLN